MHKWAAFAAAISLVAAVSAGAEETAKPVQSPPAAPQASATQSAAAAPSQLPAPAAAADADTRPFGFTHVLIKMPSGRVYATPHVGVFCIGGRTATWTSSSETETKTGPFADVLREEMKGAGYKVDGDSDNVFERTASTSDIQVAAIITNMNLDYCLPYVGYGNSSTIKGSVTLDVEWQVYSTIEKQMIAKVSTHSVAEFKDAQSGGLEALMMEAFRKDVLSLIATENFRKALTAPPSDAANQAKPTLQAQIPLTGALAAQPRRVGDAISAVVLIAAGQTQGSGFLVSSDGLMITDAHVVGDAKYVKVRWPDGIEGLGEVVRTDRSRDVALIKSDPRGRTPLRLRREPLEPGDTVFAIGAPLDSKFQSTVTRGVVSAYRTFEGLNFIQSDVSVNHGSSGGPLLDDKGQAVGATESGFQVAGAPTNINLFIPIGDALDFLSATPK